MHFFALSCDIHCLELLSLTCVSIRERRTPHVCAVHQWGFPLPSLLLSWFRQQQSIFDELSWSPPNAPDMDRCKNILKNICLKWDVYRVRVWIIFFSLRFGNDFQMDGSPQDCCHSASEAPYAGLVQTEEKLLRSSFTPWIWQINTLILQSPFSY